MFTFFVGVVIGILFVKLISWIIWRYLYYNALHYARC